MKKPIIVPSVGGAVLIAGLATSLTLMQSAFQSNDRHLTRIFAIFSVMFCIGGGTVIMMQAVRHVEQRKREVSQHRQHVSLEAGGYRATYPVRYRIAFSLMTALYGLLTLFLLLQTHHLAVKFISSSLLLFCVVTLYRFLFTTVCFTDKLIIVRLKFLTTFSESYEAVSAMHAQRGTLRIEFSDGRKVNLPSNLGDFAKITAILEKRVKMAPTYN